MKLKKPTLNKNSTNQDLASAISTACNKGFVDAMKGLTIKKNSDIISGVCSKCLERHKAAIIAAYKAGFEQASKKPKQKD